MSSYEISTERTRLDITLIHNFLSSSYWAKDIPRSIVEKSIENSFCFGAYVGPRQVAFARVITDFATFAYLADVFVLPEHRGQGVSKLLVRTIVEHPQLQGLRRFMLATKDAHGLYAQFGFEALTHPEHLMSIHHPDIYRPKS
jgi:GNAT superfamily N-acetyltransferase